MTTKKNPETSAVASTAVEVEANTRPVRHDAKGALLEKQKAAASAHRANKAGEMPDIALAEPPKPPPIRTTSIKSACKRWPEIRELYVRGLAHLFGSGAGSYNLANYMGPAAGVSLLIAEHIKRRVSTQRTEQRMKEALAPHKVQLHLAPSEVVQQKSSGQVGGAAVPQLKRPVGPSEYQAVLAVVFELRALEQVCGKTAMLHCKQQVVGAEMQLAHALDTYHPFKRPVPFDEVVRAKVEAHAADHTSTLTYTDENGEQILKVRMHLASCVEVVRQRERLRDHLKTLRNANAYLVGILRDVDRAAQAKHEAQLRLDEASEQQFARAMIAAGWTTNFDGKPYADYLKNDGDDSNV